MNPLIYFVIASTIGALGTTFFVRQSLEHLILAPDNIAKIIASLYKKVALLELIPMVFMVFGFVGIDKLEYPVDVTDSLLFLSLLVGISFILLFSKKNKVLQSLTSTRETNTYIKKLFYSGTIITMSFPLIGFVACFLMMSM